MERESIDLKRTDALALVQATAERIRGAGSGPTRRPPTVNHTRYLVRYQRTYVGRVVGGHDIPDALVLAFEKLLSPRFTRLYRRVARRCLAVDEALERGIEPGDPQVLLDSFGTARALRTAAAWDHWLERHCMSRAELLAWLRERDLERKLRDQYRAPGRQLPNRMLHGAIARDVAIRSGVRPRDLSRPLLMRPGVPWEHPVIRELKGRGRFARALKVAAEVVEHDARLARAHPWFRRSLIMRARLDAWFAGRWQVDVSALGESILDRGFSSYEEFAEPARYVYIYCRWEERLAANDCSSYDA